MGEEFSIETFIENRWAEARIELVGIAPKFVHSLEAYDGLMKHGFVLPDGIPDPEQRLPFVWYEVLEFTFDVVQSIERLQITLELLAGNTERRLAHYHYTVWLGSAYALCEKIESLVSYVCKLYPVNKKTKRGYHALIKAQVRDEIDQRRTAFVHGGNRPDGGVSIAATEITARALWEYAVFGGPQHIKTAIAMANKVGNISAQRYYSFLNEVTGIVLVRLGSVLEKVEQDINRRRTL